jgi:folylpolyglutamate synthase/dihydropteroate synthase
MMEREIAREKLTIIRRERVLIYELKMIGVRMEKVKEKEEKLKSVSFVAKMKLAFENVKENDRYKSIRTQAGRALKQIGFFNNHNVKERKNANYRAEH